MILFIVFYQIDILLRRQSNQTDTQQLITIVSRSEAKKLF